MRLIDEKGRLFGKVSLIDVLIVLTVAVLASGYLYKQISGEVRQIVDNGKVFYLTLKCEHLAEYHAQAVDEGDIIFKRYERKPLGAVTNVRLEQSTDILLMPGGTAILAEVEGCYDMYITIKCEGSITDRGYYANGSVHVAPGMAFEAHSNRWVAKSFIFSIEE